MGLSVWLYLGVINGLTSWAFADDKRRAVRSRRRIPERVLLFLAAIGGSPGALLTRKLLRHKIRKQPFSNRLWVICALQGLAAIFAASGMGR